MSPGDALAALDKIVAMGDILMTKPEKNALIHPMIRVCGIIMAMLPFIMPIIPSIAAGSLMGFGLGLPLSSGSAKNLPSWYACTMYAFLAEKAAGESTLAFWRSVRPRASERFCRILGRSCFLGVDCRSVMA